MSKARKILFNIASTYSKDKANLNWGRGRLLPYESPVSFLSKFCLLNWISPDQARLFFQSQCKVNWNVDGIDIIDCDNLKSVLNEDAECINTLPRDSLDLIIGFDSVNNGVALDSLLSRQRSSYLFKFCPACMQLGYHASFHEFDWLLKCPIHSEILLKVYKFYPHRNYISFKNYFKDFVDYINLLCPSWLEIKHNNEIFHNFKSLQFENFKKWVLISKTKVIEFNNSIALKSDGGTYEEDNIEDYFSRLNCLSPTPDSVKKILHHKIYNKSPKIIHSYKPKFLKEIGNISSKFNWDSFKYFYRIYASLTNRNCPHRVLAGEMIKSLSEHSNHCSCEWFHENHRWYKYIQDSSCKVVSSPKSRIGNIPLWINCPYNFINETLKVDWFDFQDSSTSKVKFEVWRNYLNSLESLAKIGYFIKDNSDEYSNHFNARGVLNLSKHFTQEVEELLFLELDEWLKQSFEWLAYIKSGMRPYDTPSVITNLHHVKMENKYQSIHWT